MFMLEMSWKSRFRYLSYCCSVHKYIWSWSINKVKSQKYIREYKTGCSKGINFVQTGEFSVWGIGARRGVREKGYEWLYSMENSL